MNEKEQEFPLKNLFIPLTTFKAIHFIVILGLIVYSNMLLNNFVWDDLSFIVNNPVIHTLNFFSLIGPNLFNNVIYFRPLPALYFATIYSLVGDHVFLYHLLQVGFHIANTILLFIFIKNFFKKWLALFLSLIFLVHPINVESTVFIGASTSVLFYFFGMLALLHSQKENFKKKDFVFVFCFLLLSLLSKETGIIFIFLILLYRYLFKRFQIIYFGVTGFVVFFTYILIRLLAVGTNIIYKVDIPMAKLSLMERLLNIPLLFTYYLKTFLYPKILVIDQQWIERSLDVGHLYLPLAFTLMFLGAITGFGLYIHKHKKPYWKVFLLFTLWFLLGISPILQIFPLDATVADRWFYLPIVGLLGLIGVGISIVNKNNRRLNKICILISVIVLVLLSVRTMVRNTNWQSPIVLYSHDVQYSPGSYGLENNLATELMNNKEYDQAKEHFLRAVAIRPDQWENWYNLGNLYTDMKDISSAKYAYNKAIENNINFDTAYVQYGKLLVFYDNPKVGKQFAQKSLIKFPNNTDLWLLLAIAEYKLGNRDVALVDIRKSLSLTNSENGNYVYLQIQNNLPIQAE